MKTEMHEIWMECAVLVLRANVVDSLLMHLNYTFIHMHTQFKWKTFMIESESSIRCHSESQFDGVFASAARFFNGVDAQITRSRKSNKQTSAVFFFITEIFPFVSKHKS